MGLLELKLYNLPEFLHKSNFYIDNVEISDGDKLTCIYVPSEYYSNEITIESIKSPADVIHYMGVFAYWGVPEHDIPLEFYKACIMNKDFIDLKSIEECFGQQFLKKKMSIIKENDFNHICQQACIQKELELLIAAHKCGCPFGYNLVLTAAMIGCIEYIDYIVKLYPTYFSI
jgi:hypothetical protein